jgi:hypothetical protein
MNAQTLLGIVYDGSRLSTALTQPAGHQLTAQAKSNLTVTVYVVNADGSPHNLTGKTLTLTVKRNTLQRTVPPGFSVAGVLTDAARGVVTFPVTAANNTMDPGRYVYDVVMVEGSDRTVVVPLAVYSLQPSAGV